jgi:hypothetical protein
MAVSCCAGIPPKNFETDMQLRIPSLGIPHMVSHSQGSHQNCEAPLVLVAASRMVWMRSTRVCGERLCNARSGTDYALFAESGQQHYPCRRVSLLEGPGQLYPGHSRQADVERVRISVENERRSTWRDKLAPLSTLPPNRESISCLRFVAL